MAEARAVKYDDLLKIYKARLEALTAAEQKRAEDNRRNDEELKRKEQARLEEEERRTAEDIRRNVNVSGYEGLLEGFEEDWELAMYISEMCPDRYMEKADRILDGLVSIEPQEEDRDMKIAVELTDVECDTFATARLAEEAYLRHVA